MFQPQPADRVNDPRFGQRPPIVRNMDGGVRQEVAEPLLLQLLNLPWIKEFHGAEFRQPEVGKTAAGVVQHLKDQRAYSWGLTLLMVYLNLPDADGAIWPTK